jgi:hypothetical protein
MGDKSDYESINNSLLYYIDYDYKLDQYININTKMIDIDINIISLIDKILMEESSDQELEVIQVLMSMGIISEKYILFISSEWMEIIESLYYPESRNHISKNDTGFREDNISEDDIESMERNMRLGYIRFHYDDNELPEADDLLEIINIIKE